MTRKTMKATARIGGILGGVGVLFVGGVLIASSPALADNGPHISNAGATAIGSGPDGCAGCHRIHSAKSDNGMLLVTSSEEALCATCHEGGAGATTDVVNGVQYQSIGGALTSPVQALRGGGFDSALLDAGNGTRGNSATNSVPVGASEATTSSHTMGTGTLWGNGAIGSGVGTSVDLECGSCHDPHGNGNFRILKPVGGVGTANIMMGKAVTGASYIVDPVNVLDRNNNPIVRYVYTFTFAANPGFTPGQPVAISGALPTTWNFVPTVSGTSWTQANISSVSASAPWTITIPNMVNLPTAWTSGGIVSAALPSTIKSAVAVLDSGAAYTATYTTFVNHGLSTGQKLTIIGSTVADYNISQAAITVTSANTFTARIFAAAAPSAYVSGGYISGIPDSLPVATPGAGYTSVGVNQKVYNTVNYWRADDHFYTGAYSATGVQYPTGTNTTMGESAFIINASQWCTTCHTRYLATNSTSRKFTSGDAVYTFRHTSGAYKEASPDCMQCHVAHGSNAAMTGQYSSNLQKPNGVVSSPSSLLRIDNRGTCVMCHSF